MRSTSPLLHHEMKPADWRGPPVQVITDVCTNAATTFLVNGEEYDGFETTGVVRQGCPSSGSNFVSHFHTLL